MPEPNVANNISWNSDGLVPTIVQHDRTGEVLMMAWMNREALDLTRATGEVHFWSRSRRRLWKKGETSENTLALVGLAATATGIPYWCERFPPALPATQPPEPASRPR